MLQKSMMHTIDEGSRLIRGSSVNLSIKPTDD
jgi:hypothetical protein